jgi:DNA polymerase-3 subunit epsilon
VGDDLIIDFARRFVYNDKGDLVFNFGKHKGRTIADVLKAEPQYYDWMMKGEFPMNTKQKLTEIRTKNMLKKS